MRKGEAPAGQMAASVALGGLLALGVALMALLLGAALVSRGVLKEDAAPQLTAGACVLGSFLGGLLACGRWRTRRVLAGLLAGAVCALLLLAVGLLLGGGLEFGPQALIELAGCLCGGAAAGVLSRRGKGKKRASGRKK